MIAVSGEAFRLAPYPVGHQRYRGPNRYLCSSILHDKLLPSMECLLTPAVGGRFLCGSSLSHAGCFSSSELGRPDLRFCRPSGELFLDRSCKVINV